MLVVMLQPPVENHCNAVQNNPVSVQMAVAIFHKMQILCNIFPHTLNWTGNTNVFLLMFTLRFD